MLKRIIFSLLVPCISLIYEISFAGEINGTVEFVLSSTGLIRVNEEIEVVALDKVAAIKGVDSFRSLETGDRIRVKYSKEIAGVKIADEIEAESLVSLDPRYLINTDELISLLNKRQGVMLVDSRPRKQYGAGHIPGAISIPDSEFEFHIRKLPRNKEKLMIFYSDALRSFSSHNSRRKAMARGYTNVKVYNEGFKAWVKARNYAEAEQPYIKKPGIGSPILLIDTRPRERALRGYIPGAISIPLEEMKQSDFFSAYWEPPLVFYGEDENDGRPAQAALKAINWDYHIEANSNAPVNVLKGGFQGWKRQGNKISEGEVKTVIVYEPSIGEITLEEFKKLWNSRSRDVIFLDVGKGMTFEWVTSIPYNELHLRISELPKGKEIIAYCTAGYRAMIAYHILKKNDYRVRFLKSYLLVKSDGTIE